MEWKRVKEFMKKHRNKILAGVVVFAYVLFAILAMVLPFPNSYFTIFGLDIYIYGVLIATGMLVCFIVACMLWKEKGYRNGDPYWLLVFIIPLALLGLRLMYMAFTPERVNFFDFRSGGLALYGGIIGGAIGLLLFSWWRRSSPFAISDIIVVGMILGQAIGRWGNFFNEEIYGLSTGGFSFPPLTVVIGGNNHLATFFYESVLNLIGFFVLWFVFKHSKKCGTTTAAYFIYYGTVRAVLEPLRDTSHMLGNGSDIIINRVYFLISLLIIVGGIVILLLNRKGWIYQQHDRLLEINRPKKIKPEKQDKGEEEVDGKSIQSESCGVVSERVGNGDAGQEVQPVSNSKRTRVQRGTSDSERIENGKMRDSKSSSHPDRKAKSSNSGTDDDFPF